MSKQKSASSSSPRERRARTRAERVARESVPVTNESSFGLIRQRAEPFAPQMTPALQSDCLAALSASASEVAATAMDGARFEELGSLEDYGDGYGAYLGLVVEEEPIQVGIVVDEPGCQALAKSLLGMAQAEDDLPAADVSDAMCEVINIIAGGLKRRVGDRAKIAMGLPIFVAGPALPNQHQQMAGRALKIGDVRVSLLLLTQRPDVKALARAGALQTAVATPAKESNA